MLGEVALRYVTLREAHNQNCLEKSKREETSFSFLQFVGLEQKGKVGFCTINRKERTWCKRPI